MAHRVFCETITNQNFAGFMKNLIEVSRILTKKKVRKIEIIDSTILDNPESKFGQFYEALMGNKLRNDRDAATLLYNSSPTSDKYRQLKSRFRKRLFNTLFFLDINTPSAGSYERAYYSCNKDWTLVKILIANEAFLSAKDLARSILTTALKFNFADVIVNTSRILREFAAKEEDEKEFEVYDAYLKEFSPVLQAEHDSEEAFQRIRLKMKTPKDKLPEVLPFIDEQCNKLVELSEQYDSPVVFYNMYMGWICNFEIQRDFNSMLLICERAEDYINKHPQYYQDNVLAAFQLRKMSAFLHLKDFSNGQATAEKALETFTAGSQTWSKFLEYYLLLALHSGNYIHALAIYSRAVKHKKFNKIDLATRERWKVYEVYLHYFMELLGTTKSNIPPVGNYSFRLSRFLSDPIVYPKDQRVFTIHLVIAQLLFCLGKDEHMAADCVNRLRLYANKQLKKEENNRLIQFIRLLNQLSRADFEPSELRNTEKYLSAMQETPFHYRGLTSEWEIIPLEDLWSHILNRLGAAMAA
ncbi:MAG: hypothetical protein CMN32_08090 [Saprospirales bacterium]|nr:hypothetical protein [Saprospirales bacterium]